MRVRYAQSGIRLGVALAADFCYRGAQIPKGRALPDPFSFHPAKLETRMQVLVRDNNVDQAIRVLKKKLQREGVFREMKRRASYEKPSEQRAREKAEAVRRARKLARKQAQREGLIAAPKPKVMKPRAASAAAPR
jgi:small subunit ribosomal protein S21